MKLVIVESPAKAKTIRRFLGPDYEVEASFGHIRDLPRSASEIPARLKSKSWARLGVNVEENFEPVYVLPREARKHISALRAKARKAEELILATDEDREGESISWHLVEVLKPKVPVRRIAFHEITRNAIREALAQPRRVDEKLVRAQETRRVLDRLFGYSLSPVLWKKVKAKLSAGRVQSAALRLLVEREEERQAFKSSEYWRVQAALRPGETVQSSAPSDGGNGGFFAELVETGGRTIATSKDFDSITGALRNSKRVLVLDEAHAIRIAEEAMRLRPWRVARVEEKQARRRPSPPFTTSTLQQAASSQLRMTPRRTMMLAQQLYEGIDLDSRTARGEREGLITYMRTDSTSLSAKALADAAGFIKQHFGAEYYQGARRYKTRSRAAQEAHEAIRPTEIRRTPEILRPLLDKDQLRLYRLIWRRAVASQMADARIARTTIDFRAGSESPGDAGPSHLFRATGSVVRFPGFLRVLGTSGKDVILPPLIQGRWVGGDAREEPRVDITRVEPFARRTRPRSRYSEASLVRKLEEEGIGRPSTYEPTLAKLREREYAVKKKGALVPTYIGLAVTQLLRNHFPKYVDLKFTAGMEDDLDQIAGGLKDPVRFLSAFFRGEGDGQPGLEKRIEEALPRIDYPALPVGEDPETGEPLFVKIGRNHVYLQQGDGDGKSPVAAIPVDLLVDELTPEKASQLIAQRLQGEQPLGTDPESGLNVYVRSGPFGPYVQLGEDGPEKPKRASLSPGTQPGTVGLEDALKLLSLPRILGEDPKTGQRVEAGFGKFGPYVRRVRTYRNLDAPERVFTIGLEEALALLNAKPGKTVLAVVGEHPQTQATLNVYRGRYGPYVSDGVLNASIPRGRDPASLEVEEAVDLLARAAARKAKGRRRKPAPKKKTRASRTGTARRKR